MSRAVLTALVAAAAAATTASAGSYSPPPGDHQPVWSPDGSAIVYLARASPTRHLRVMAPDGSGNRALPLPSLGDVGPTPFVFSPDWFWVAFGQNELVVSHPDGTVHRALSDMVFAAVPAWSPDGRQLAFSRADGLYVVDVDGSRLRRLVSGAGPPAWSPDGEQIAFTAGFPEESVIRVIRPDGSGERELAAALPGAHRQPVWSPDGARLAFLTYDQQTWKLTVTTREGELLGQSGMPNNVSSVVWSPEGNRLLLSIGAVYLYDLSTSRLRLLFPFGASATWAPDGAAITFEGGGECKDRSAIYRAALDGSPPVRLTNDCRIRGTPASDRLEGTELADVLVGLGGDDFLAAQDLAYAGDDLYGGTGADTLTGGALGDRLEGGPGSDRLRAGAGPDVVRGGSGSDGLRGEGGRDQLYAQDGQRDTVSCGTNRLRGTGPEDDVAWADRHDDFSRDCEFVYRAGRIDLAAGLTRLAIRVNSAAAPGERDTVWTLRCRPAGGTLPGAAEACRRLGSMTGPFAPISYDRLCANTPDPADARVSGLLGGKSVETGFGRSNTCERERWNRHRFLLAER